MKHIKITNYTTQDWLKQMGTFFCSMALAQAFLRKLLAGDYLTACGWLLGAVGWLIIYLQIMKGIEKKNPQE